MGISIRQRSPEEISRNQSAGMGVNWGGPGGAGGLAENIENAFAQYGGPTSPIGYNPSIVAGNAPAVNTGNEFGMGVPTFAPSQWGSFDMPTLSPTIGFNNQPYVETFNAGFPAQMNPAYNIDNIQQPAFLGYPNQIGVNNAPWINPFGSMIGGTGFQTQYGPDN